jgi:sodium/proline symporter
MDRETVIFVTFAAYLVVMLIAGALGYRYTRNLSDYLLGGRRLGSLTTALSAEASDMSGWLLLGLPGLAYVAGLDAGWMALGLLAGTYVNWRWLAPRLRRHPDACGDSLTLSDYLEARFKDRSRVLRVLVACTILFFFLIYTSSGLVAGGKLFNSVFGLPYVGAVTVGAVAIVAYTLLGGFLAVCWTDAIQGVLMLAALVAVPLVALAQVGGVEQAMSAIASTNVHLLDPLRAADGRPISWIAVASLLGWGLGYFGQPHILARFMAIRAAGEIRRARWTAMTWVTTTLVGALTVGLVGIAAHQSALSATDSEKIFILLVDALLHPVPAGICLAAVLAAIMSTADSQLLVSSSALAEDLYRPFIRPRAGQRELVWIGRAAVVVIAACAYVLALDPQSKVLELVAYAWAGFGAAFGPTLLLSLFWTRMTRGGALAGILVGALTVPVWRQLSGGLFDLYELVPGFFFSTVAIVMVSLWQKTNAG